MFYLFAFSYCSRGSQSKSTEVVFHSLSSGPHSVRPLHHDLSVVNCAAVNIGVPVFFRIVVFSEYILVVQWKRQKDRTLKDELPRSVGAQYATGDQWRNNSRKNKGMEPKQKQQLWM